MRDVFVIAEIAVLIAAAGGVIYSVILLRRAIAEQRSGRTPSDKRRKRPY
jgi:hypothetical protein